MTHSLRDYFTDMTTDGFLNRVNKELRALEKREGDLSARHEAIQRERATIRTRTAELTKFRSMYQEFMGEGPEGSQTAEIPTDETGEAPAVNVTPLVPDREPISIATQDRPATNGPTAPPTTADVAASVMAAQGGRAKIRDILDEAVRIGKLAGKSSDYGSVFGALKNNPKRFVKVGPGEFELVGAVDQAAEQQA